MEAKGSETNRSVIFHRKTSIRIIMALLCLAATFTASATQERTLLIVNSYTESAPWARAMIHPISNYISTIKDVHCEMVHLNNVLVKDSLSYQKASEHIFKPYHEQNRRPDYVVFIGYLAFTLRDSVVANWGRDIPMLMITRSPSYRDITDTYAGYEYGTPQETPISSLRDKYNLTVIEDTDHYKETIDLMDRLIPDMDTLVFISDAIPVNRALDDNIRRYVRNNYPNITYKWVKTTPEGNEQLKSYFINKTDKTGLLLSSWNIISHDTQGNQMASMGEIMNLYASINPVFCLRESYMDLGAVGGVFSNPDNIRQDIITAIDAMLAGKPMRDVPIQNGEETVQPVLNYELMQNYGLNESNCPDGTVFIHKKESFWETHIWHFLAVVLLILLLIVIFVGRSKSQAAKIRILRRNQDFMEHMPVPFSKADIIFNVDGKVREIEYTKYNESFKQLLDLNSRPDIPTKMFPYDFIAKQTDKLVETEKPVHFTYTFEKSGRSYDFLLCNVDLSTHKKKGGIKIKEVDIFANDITDRIKLETDLKEITARFDATITLSGVIPWVWYVKQDLLVFDAYSLFTRLNRDLNNPKEAHQSKISAQEYLALLPEEDKHKLITVRKGLLEGSIKDFKEYYRLKTTSQGKDIYLWIEGSGMVTKYNEEDNLPEIMIGSCIVISDYLDLGISNDNNAD